MARGSFHFCHRRTRTRSAVDTLLNKRSQILDCKTKQIPSFLPLTHGVADGFARRRIFASIDRASHKSRHLRCQCNCNLLDRRHRSSLLLVTSMVCYWRTGSKRPIGRARGQLLDFLSASAFRPGRPAVRIRSRRAIMVRRRTHCVSDRSEAGTAHTTGTCHFGFSYTCSHATSLLCGSSLLEENSAPWRRSCLISGPGADEYCMLSSIAGVALAIHIRSQVRP
ncbi:Hypothetical protein NGAL_HAMBI1145_15220 [Neorhizobium galegae bv. officinalis]|uniref:Uncharacterized protein n=1 Tax=Neorhizobium galegae bv. officinalis TaxID=323656 RepID=A0A0T7FCW2_NEOGA|nr:Hypothetical protein NGAL_HAMBI1145_15220 [Neorhizobium galegae bv. officinalis]